MRRAMCSAACAIVFGVVASDGPTPGLATLAAAKVDPHAYFNALIARGDFWKGYSLRPQPGAPNTSAYYEHQLKGPHQGGYASTSS